MPSLLGTGPGMNYMHVDVSAENVQKVNIAQCINSTAMKRLIVSFEEWPDVEFVLMWMSALMSLLLLTSVEGYLFNLYFSRTGTWWYKWLRLILGVNYVLIYILSVHPICFFNTFAATDELSCQLMWIVRCHVTQPYIGTTSAKLNRTRGWHSGKNCPCSKRVNLWIIICMSWNVISVDV